MKQKMRKECLIVTDSCCELPKDYELSANFIKVPFIIQIDDKEYLDDGSIVREELLIEMHNSKETPKSACPSPDAFLKAFESAPDAKFIFVITVSSKLSGSFNSAILASNIWKDKNKNKNKNKNKSIFVFDSCGASATESNIVIKINDYLKNNYEDFKFEELVLDVRNYIQNQNTYFVLHNYESFIKSGRISKLKGLFADFLNIYPVMKGVNGEIELAAKSRGINKALIKLVDYMEKDKDELKDRTLVITHCNAPTSLNLILRYIEERNLKFKDIVINKTDGLSTMYAQDDGIILSF